MGQTGGPADHQPIGFRVVGPGFSGVRMYLGGGQGPGRGDSDIRVAGSWAREGDVIWVFAGSGQVT